MANPQRSPRSRPLYSQIRELLIGRMVSGDWRPGHMLPSEFKIAEEYGVSQGTVRKAIEDMEAEKLVVRRQGKGTFVIARSLPATKFHFFRIAADTGEKLPPPGNRILLLKREPASPHEMKALDLKRDTHVCRLHRVRLFHNVPTLIEQIVLPETIFPNFEEIYRNDPQPHVYLVFERKFGIVVTRADEELRAVSASADEAAALEIPEGTALLRIDRVGYGIGDRPIEIRRLICHTAKYHYRNSLGSEG
ncbi:MAG: GntR family transcriptional regulator [Gemmatimonas sp.]